MNKRERHKIILEIINENEVCTQDELTLILNQMGYSVSQSTVSRDINELNLIKSDGREKKSRYVHALDTGKTFSPQKMNILKQSTLSIEFANNLIVVKTLSGHANAVALAVDELSFSQVLGTVAGDDVVLIVAKSNADAEIVVKSLRAF